MDDSFRWFFEQRHLETSSGALFDSVVQGGNSSGSMLGCLSNSSVNRLITFRTFTLSHFKEFWYWATGRHLTGASAVTNTVQMWNPDSFTSARQIKRFSKPTLCLTRNISFLWMYLELVIAKEAPQRKLSGNRASAKEQTLAPHRLCSYRLCPRVVSGFLMKSSISRIVRPIFSTKRNNYTLLNLPEKWVVTTLGLGRLSAGSNTAEVTDMVWE